MDLTRHVEALRQQLMIAADPGGEPARELAGRLVVSLDASARLVLLEALSTAADEITRELAPGSVEVRLRGSDPEFVVTLPEPEPAATERADGDGETNVTSPRPLPPVDSEDGGTSRITLRLPEQLKVRIEEAAGSDGISVNSWLVRSISNAVDSTGHSSPPPRRNPTGGQRVTGWAR